MADNTEVFELIDSKLGELQGLVLGYANSAVTAAMTDISYLVQQESFDTKPRWRADPGEDGDPGLPDAALGHEKDLDDLPNNLPTLAAPTIDLSKEAMTALMPGTDLYKYYSVLFDTYLEQLCKDIADNTEWAGSFADPAVQTALFNAGDNRNLTAMNAASDEAVRKLSSQRGFPTVNGLVVAAVADITNKYQDNVADKVNADTTLIAERLHDARKHAISSMLQMEEIRSRVYGQLYGYYFALVNAQVDIFKTKAMLNVKRFEQELDYLRRLDQNDQFDVQTAIHNDKMWQEQQIRRLLAQVDALKINLEWDQKSLSEQVAAAKFGSEAAARLYGGTSGMLNAIDLNDKTGTA
jgi:hypothetical protein